VTENEKSTFSSNSGPMFHIFLESELIEMIKHIQKNENLKDEREVIIRAIQNYIKKGISDSSRQQERFEDEILQTTFDGNTENKKNIEYLQTLSFEKQQEWIQEHPGKLFSQPSENTFDGNIEIQKLEKILAQVTSENLIEKLPQHEMYGMESAAIIFRFHTKILPVKFSLLCLSKMMIEQDSPWIDLNELKQYTLDSAKIFIQKFDSSSIRYKLKARVGFPIFKRSKVNVPYEDLFLVYVRSCKRFQEQFVGRKLHATYRLSDENLYGSVHMGGACFEMGLVNAKSMHTEESHPKSGKIFVTLSPNGKEFVKLPNNLINFIYNDKENEPSSIFSQQETEFYFKKILPKFKFENDFVEHLMKHEQIEHTREIKIWFEEKFLNFCNSEFPGVNIPLQENTVRIYSNTIMNRLMEFGVFTKDPKSKSGPYTRMKNLSDLR